VDFLTSLAEALALGNALKISALSNSKVISLEISTFTFLRKNQRSKNKAMISIVPTTTLAHPFCA
jgi:hypothetical protein